mmetsp:Transcript_168917/g.543023  ORF Transcript_168917/g.543023 Transcript_168917/m.543023 type:complete len:1174 (+) Transcript_168917:52-3573(+)
MGCHAWPSRRRGRYCGIARRGVHRGHCAWICGSPRSPSHTRLFDRSGIRPFGNITWQVGSSPAARPGVRQRSTCPSSASRSRGLRRILGPTCSWCIASSDFSMTGMWRTAGVHHIRSVARSGWSPKRERSEYKASINEDIYSPSENCMRGTGQLCVADLLAWSVVVAVDPRECQAELRVHAYFPPWTFSAQLLATPLRTAQTPLQQEMLAPGRKVSLGFGYLTLDLSRQVVCLLERDGLVATVPLVGVWVDLIGGSCAEQAVPVAWWDAAQVAEHPAVCLAAARFVHGGRVQERVWVDHQTFLITVVHATGTQGQASCGVSPCVSFFEATYSEATASCSNVLVAPAGSAWTFEIDALQQCLGTEIWELPTQFLTKAQVGELADERAENPEEDVPVEECNAAAEPADAGQPPPSPPPSSRCWRPEASGLDLALSGLDLPRPTPPRPHLGPDGPERRAARAAEARAQAKTPAAPSWSAPAPGAQSSPPRGGHPLRYSRESEGSVQSPRCRHGNVATDDAHAVVAAAFDGAAAKEWIRKLDVEMTGSVSNSGGRAALVNDAPGSFRDGNSPNPAATSVGRDLIDALLEQTTRQTYTREGRSQQHAGIDTGAAGAVISKSAAHGAQYRPGEDQDSESLRYLVSAQREQLTDLQQQVAQLQALVLAIAQPLAQGQLNSPAALAMPSSRHCADRWQALPDQIRRPQRDADVVAPRVCDASVNVGESLAFPPRSRDIAVGVGNSIEFSMSSLGARNRRPHEVGVDRPESDHDILRNECVTSSSSQVSRTREQASKRSEGMFSLPEMPAVAPVIRPAQHSADDLASASARSSLEFASALRDQGRGVPLFVSASPSELRSDHMGISVESQVKADPNAQHDSTARFITMQARHQQTQISGGAAASRSPLGSTEHPPWKGSTSVGGLATSQAQDPKRVFCSGGTPLDPQDRSLVNELTALQACSPAVPSDVPPGRIAGNFEPRGKLEVAADGRSLSRSTSSEALQVPAEVLWKVVAAEEADSTSAGGSVHKVKEWLSLGCAWSAGGFSSPSASSSSVLNEGLMASPSSPAPLVPGGLRDSADTAGGASPRGAPGARTPAFVSPRGSSAAAGALLGAVSEPGIGSAAVGGSAAGALTWTAGLTTTAFGSPMGGAFGLSDGVPRILRPPSLSSLGSASTGGSEDDD